MSSRDIPLLAIGVAAGSLLAACDDGPAPPSGPVITAQRVVVTPDSVEIDVFGEASLSAIVYGPGNQVLEGRAVEWSSDDTTLAVVSDAGVVTGRGVGRVSIAASLDGVQASGVVVLTSPPIERVVASPESVVVAEGRSKALPALVAVDELGREIARYPFEIGASSDAAVATLDAGGVVTGHAVGRAAVVVRAGTAAATVRIRVDPQWVEVHAAFRFWCALRADGRAYCWGNNDRMGHLGRGESVGGDPGPKPVLGEQRFRQLSVGEHHTCGVATDGQTYCWGWNALGTLGTGDFTDRYAPTPVVNSGELGFESVTVGEEHTCALTAEGAAYCWGRNLSGSLGIGSPDEDVPVPTAVAGDHVFRQVTTGSWTRTCALTPAGEAYCWGGVRPATSAKDLCPGPSCYEPVPVAEGLVFEELRDAYKHTCGRTAAGEAYCWGYREAEVRHVDSDVPVTTLGPITVFGKQACGLTEGGAARCWELGNSLSIPPTLTAVPIEGGASMKWIGTGYSGSAGMVCGIGADDLAYCWRSLTDPPELIPAPGSGPEP